MLADLSSAQWSVASPGFPYPSAIFWRCRWYLRASSRCARIRVSAGMGLNMTVSSRAMVLGAVIAFVQRRFRHLSTDY